MVLGHVEDVIQTAPPTVSSGMFYCLLFLLFECSFKYIKSVDTYSLILVKSSEEKAVLPLDKVRILGNMLELVHMLDLMRNPHDPIPLIHMIQVYKFNSPVQKFAFLKARIVFTL